MPERRLPRNSQSRGRHQIPRQSGHPLDDRPNVLRRIAPNRPRAGPRVLALGSRVREEGLRTSTRSGPRTCSDVGYWLPPVLPCRQGDGSTRRALDPPVVRESASGSETVQRAAPRAAAHVAVAVLQASPAAPPESSRARGRRALGYVRTPAGQELRPVVEALGTGALVGRRTRRRGSRSELLLGDMTATSTTALYRRRGPSSTSGPPTHQPRPVIGGR